MEALAFLQMLEEEAASWQILSALHRDTRVVIRQQW